MRDESFAPKSAGSDAGAAGTPSTGDGGPVPSPALPIDPAAEVQLPAEDAGGRNPNAVPGIVAPEPPLVGTGGPASPPAGGVAPGAAAPAPAAPSPVVAPAPGTGDVVNAADGPHSPAALPID